MDFAIDPLTELRNRQSAKWTVFDDAVIPLFVAEMDFPLAAPIAEVLHRAVRRSDTGYAAPTHHLAAAVAGYADRTWGWSVEEHHVRTVVDVGMAVVETMRRVVAPGDRVVVSPPAYEPYAWWVSEVGGTLVEAPLADGPDGWRLDLPVIEEAFSKNASAYLLCSPHNPVGLVHPREDLVELARLAAKYGVYVLSDEIHAPLVFSEHEFVPFLSVSDDAREWGFSFLSASKAWNIAGLKAAVVVTAATSTKRYVDRFSPHSGYRTGHLGVLATVAAFSEGDAWLADAMHVLDHNRRLLKELLATSLPEVGYRPPQASFLAWLDFRAFNWGEDIAAHILEHASVALNDGGRYGAMGQGFARLNFACAPDVLTEAVTRIAALR